MTTIKGPTRKFFARFASVRKVHLDVDPYLVTTTFEIGNAKTVVSTAQQKRLNAIASEVLDDFEDRMHDVLLDTDKKIQALLDKAEKAGGAEVEKAKVTGQKMADDTLKSIKQTTDQIEKLLQVKVKAAFQSEKVFKEIDTEFKVSVAYKLAKSTVSLAKSTAELVIAPISPKVWYDIAKTIYAAGEVIYDAGKGEEKLRKELFDAIAKHTTHQMKLWKQLPDDTTSEKFKKGYATFKAWRSDTSGKLEAARKRYDVDLGKKLKSVDAASKKLDAARKKLNAELKTLPPGEGLKRGIPAGAKLMQVQRQVSGYAAALSGMRKFADDMAMLVREMGVEVDRDSFQAKMRKFLVEPKDIASMAKQIYDDVSDVKDTIETIIKAAGG